MVWVLTDGYCGPCQNRHIRESLQRCRHGERSKTPNGTTYLYVCSKRAVSGGYCLEHVPVEAEAA